MGLDADLLNCLALERQMFFLYGRWGASAGRDTMLTEILSRLADQSDRHRASLWDLALRHDLMPPPRFEPEAMARADYIDEAKLTLRRALEDLSALADALDGFERDQVQRIRNEDEAQLRQLLILAPEPRPAVAAGRERPGHERELFRGEPRWRPGIE